MLLIVEPGSGSTDQILAGRVVRDPYLYNTADKVARKWC